MESKKIDMFIFDKPTIAPIGISYSLSKDKTAIVINFIGFSNNKSGNMENHVSESVMLTKDMVKRLIKDLETIINNK
mgnify:CR=1 FL=1